MAETLPKEGSGGNIKRGFGWRWVALAFRQCSHTGKMPVPPVELGETLGHLCDAGRKVMIKARD